MDTTFIRFLSMFFVALILMLLRARPWWCCRLSRAFVTSNWREEFDNLCDWYAHLLRQSPKRTIHIRVLGNTITANPFNVEHMLKTNFSNYPKGKAFSSILGDLLGRGIFNADGDIWRFQRKMASLELGSVSVRNYAFHIVAEEVRNRLLPLLASISAEKEVIDMQDVFRRFSFDTICKVSFGVDPGCLELSLPISEFAAAFDTASRISACRATTVSPWIWKAKRFLNCGTERELRRAICLINALAEEVIRQRRKMGQFSSNDDLLSKFMGSVNDDVYLRDIVISFLLAGRDTVASGLTAFFLLLSKHPEIQTSMLEEINKYMGAGRGRNETPTYDELRGLHYVHAALYESMRLYPPVQFDSRFAVEDDVLPDGTFVKKGTRLTYHPYAMGRMEEIWGKDCMEFKPQRWLENGVFAPASPFKYPVFHAGNRVCLGKEMAVMEMKAVAVAVIRRFRVEVIGKGRSPKFASGLTASLHGGLRAHIEERD